MPTIGDQVLAEIHTHNHYYLVQQQDGTLQELPGLSNTSPAMVQVTNYSTLARSRDHVLTPDWLQAMLNTSALAPQPSSGASCSCPSSGQVSVRAN